MVLQMLLVLCLNMRVSCKLPAQMKCTLMYAMLIRINALVSMLQAHSNLLNQSTGEILIKNHQIQVHICHSTNRMKVYRNVQKNHSRKHMLNPDLGNKTRWDNFIEEAKRAVTIMGDVCETNVKLLGPGGDDCHLLTPAEAAAKDYSRLTYTYLDKMILRQFECAAGPAITFSKFTQDNRDTFSYILF